MFSNETVIPAYEKEWLDATGAYEHSRETIARIKELEASIGIPAKKFYQLLSAADKITSAAMWLAVHQTYAKNVYTDGRSLSASDFKTDPQGHLGGALNMIPAYVGYMLANALSGITRAWVMEQGHAVSGIDSVNLLLGNMSEAHEDRYSVSDYGISRFCEDFYSYKIDAKGKQESPLGSHVNPNTAGGFLEGGYLGFASLQYVHMPLKNEHLVAFLSDGAFEEQKGADWIPRWWRAEDSGPVCPIMIANGRRIDQRTTMDQEGGPEWFSEYLKLHDFDPIIFDGRDPAAFAWVILEQEKRLERNVAELANVNNYKIKIPYGIAVAPKGAGFYNEGTNYAHNLPLLTNPSKDPVAAERFNSHANKLFVPVDAIKNARKILNNHKDSKRILEKDNPLANRNVKLKQEPKLRWKTPSIEKKSSPMDAIDLAFLLTVKANKHLRPRVGNPDEMLSNKMNDTLEELKFRVVSAEGGLHESTLGNVITALNEEAVAAAAFGNKGGINIVVTYEAFGSKMFGEARQEVIFSKHQKDFGRPAKWLSVPLIMTSNTWENSKNELSHQDPSLSESMLSESSDISRVVYPADYNSALAVINTVYQTHGEIWTVVAPKAEVPTLFSQKEAESLIEDGAIRVAEYQPAKANFAIIAIG
ncbi:MAG: D-xylulose 5-phosphate/D-fructose 6-phosphate phosphoketolase, partial [Rickettsiaceae bacterium]|nr:D-xylulose 5-phosphate/D-fructose 6-phosphate phosphoketolase [Rickettsiaceae bacterium]